MSERLNENISAIEDSLERLKSNLPMPTDAQMLADEALNLRMASMQIGFLATDVGHQQMRQRLSIDRQKKAANDTDEL